MCSSSKKSAPAPAPVAPAPNPNNVADNSNTNPQRRAAIAASTDKPASFGSELGTGV